MVGVEPEGGEGAQRGQGREGHVGGGQDITTTAIKAKTEEIQIGPSYPTSRGWEKVYAIGTKSKKGC